MRIRHWLLSLVPLVWGVIQGACNVFIFSYLCLVGRCVCYNVFGEVPFELGLAIVMTVVVIVITLYVFFQYKDVQVLIGFIGVIEGVFFTFIFYNICTSGRFVINYFKEAPIILAVIVIVTVFITIITVKRLRISLEDDSQNWIIPPS